MNPTTTLKLGTWHDIGSMALPLRLDVFVAEQGVPEELEHDDDDTRALHAVIVHDDVALATGRLLSIAGGTGKIGRLAVKRSLRGQGLGRQVLTALLQAARQQGVKRIHLHAQCGAQAFYEAEGFKAVGEPFEEAGIDHILMVKAL